MVCENMLFGNHLLGIELLSIMGKFAPLHTILHSTSASHLENLPNSLWLAMPTIGLKKVCKKLNYWTFSMHFHFFRLGLCKCKTKLSFKFHILHNNCSLFPLFSPCLFLKYSRIFGTCPTWPLWTGPLKKVLFKKNKKN